MDQKFSIRDLLEQKIVPVGKTQLMNLIRKGEKKKDGNLPEGSNYLIAGNIGTGEKRARWAVEKSEVDAWFERAKKSSRI